MSVSWLSAIFFLPGLGALGLAVLPGEIDHRLARLWALVVAGLTFALSILVALRFDFTSAQQQFVESASWLPQLGISYSLGVDGLSLPLVLLNGLLVVLSILTSWQLSKRPRLYYVLVMLLMCGVNGAFMSRDAILFFLSYELELIPLYFLISIWGGKRREYAGTKFLLYTFLSGIALLVAFLSTYYFSGTGSFSLDVLAKPQTPYPLVFQFIALGLITFGFGIKMPLVPLHTWLPDAHVEAPTAVSVLLAGILLKLGTYGIVRFGLGLFPEAAVQFAWLLSVLAAINVIYASLAAMAQTDMKKMVAYSSIAHMGYVVLGIASLNVIGLGGAMFQMVSHGIISGLLFMLVGLVYDKAGTRELPKLGGLFATLPVVGAFLVGAGMANAGMPGMSGFVAEFLVFRGGIERFPVATVLCIFGIVLTAAYILAMLARAFFGKLPKTLEAMPHVTFFDMVPATVLLIIMVGLGLFPNIMTTIVQPSVTALVEQVQTGSAVAQLPR
ncbi:complex I subunit 4 family protein [Gloeobacter kilaueensis]|uniref:NAD(P)H-quinone oxidoreductase subunit 4 n=1 Tax=Gloeobacter kilaueensis (strain ATCC BAA-2537 / CCAP 1431/1 / ULC 316 / JS1) TaxID=1183438 RepID=U5QRV0_GLOK1|nr:NuoM family protein [Gloeobacter kilaueensis]AGY60339.1 NAD(P)H-quinone oxidoreductase subunit 4 [Gloeobacter kilaueensis JS1]